MCDKEAGPLGEGLLDAQPILQGLVSQTEMNGRVCSVVCWNKALGRYHVRTEKCGDILGVRPENLLLNSNSICQPLLLRYRLLRNSCIVFGSVVLALAVLWLRMSSLDSSRSRMETQLAPPIKLDVPELNITLDFLLRAESSELENYNRQIPVAPCESSGTRHDMSGPGLTPDGRHAPAMNCRSSTMTEFVHSIRGGELPQYNYIKLEDLCADEKHSNSAECQWPDHEQERWVQQLGRHVMQELMPRAHRAHLDSIVGFSQELRGLNEWPRFTTNSEDDLRSAFEARRVKRRAEYLEDAIAIGNAITHRTGKDEMDSILETTHIAAATADDEAEAVLEQELTITPLQLLETGWRFLLRLMEPLMRAKAFPSTNQAECHHMWALWVGANGSKTALHYDADAINYLYVASGLKRVVLIPHTESPLRWNQCDAGKFVANSCWVQEDVLSHPPNASVVFYVGAGEALLIPYLHWHSVENLEPTVAMSYRTDCKIVNPERIVREWKI